MKILLDTSAIIEFLKGNKKVLDIIENAFTVFVSVISIYEALRGEEYLESLGSRSSKELLFEFIESVDILDFSVKDAILASKIWATLRKRKENVNDADIILSSQALNRDLIIVTKDRDFQKVQQIYPKLQVTII